MRKLLLILFVVLSSIALYSTEIYNSSVKVVLTKNVKLYKSTKTIEAIVGYLILNTSGDTKESATKSLEELLKVVDKSFEFYGRVVTNNFVYNTVENIRTLKTIADVNVKELPILSKTKLKREILLYTPDAVGWTNCGNQLIE